jgi:hypothetical protein
VFQVFGAAYLTMNKKTPGAITRDRSRDLSTTEMQVWQLSCQNTVRGYLILTTTWLLLRQDKSAQNRTTFTGKTLFGNLAQEKIAFIMCLLSEVPAYCAFEK